MSNTDFKTHIENIRKEALSIEYSIVTMDGYLNIWNKYIKWKNESHFIYDENEYSKFLLEYYNFDVKTYTNKSKSHYQQLMRSKRILDDFNSYKLTIQKHKALSLCNIKRKERSPRVHDLRHTFIVRSIEKAFKDGKDFNLFFPYLQTYVGHKSIDSLEYYFHLTTPILDSIKPLIEEKLGYLIPEIDKEFYE